MVILSHTVIQNVQLNLSVKRTPQTTFRIFLQARKMTVTGLTIQCKTLTFKTGCWNKNSYLCNRVEVASKTEHAVTIIGTLQSHNFFWKKMGDEAEIVQGPLNFPGLAIFFDLKKKKIKQIGFIWFKSDFFNLNQFFSFQPPNTTRSQPK